MQRLAYKVVSIETGMPTSIFYYESYSLKYPVGEWVKPEIGKILCFDSLKNAINFLKLMHNDYVVYMVEVKNPIKMQFVTGCTKKEIKRFWNWWQERKENFDMKYAQQYPGIIGVDAVKLIHPVNTKNLIGG